MEKEDRSINTLLWNIRERLIGEIIPSLRGIACEWQNSCIRLFFYHDGELNDEVNDHYYCIGTEVIADYINATIKETIISAKYPEPLPKHLFWAYKRKEPFIDPPPGSLQE